VRHTAARSVIKTSTAGHQDKRVEKTIHEKYYPCITKNEISRLILGRFRF
jgi:hypothetical protein